MTGLNISDKNLQSRIAKLESQFARTQAQIESIGSQLTSFSIVPEYERIEKEAQHITVEIKKLSNENFVDRQHLALCNSQLNLETNYESINVANLFAEAKIYFGESLIRDLREVEEFQKQVATNRRDFLEEEVRVIRLRIVEREFQLNELDLKLQKLMSILQSGGALEDFLSLQSHLSEVRSENILVKRDIDELRALQDEKAGLKTDEANLALRIDHDIRERYELRKGIIARFSEIIEMLYGERASMMVSRGDGGFKFEVDLPKTGSDGVRLMAIFAFDVAVIEDLCKNATGPHFLIHDSALFSDVDERQTANAIEIASASSKQFNYQHILTMNSDTIPFEEFSDEFIFDDNVILRLHDRNETGGILGQRI